MKKLRKSKAKKGKSGGKDGEARPTCFPQPPLVINVEEEPFPRTALVLQQDRHKRFTPCPIGTVTPPWKLDSKAKTSAAALVMCLNIGVDPPDVLKPSPCARAEAWIDPFSGPVEKVTDSIGKALQRQYERWQPRARYKHALDPTRSHVRKTLTALRRAARSDRVLFHYNGHGVPRPTENGEMWVFNENYTQYIPLSIFEVQSWMKGPSVYVFDCNNAARMMKFYHHYVDERAKDPAQAKRVDALRDVFIFAACREDETLTTNPSYPADLFTACITTPVRTALRWHCQHTLLDASKLLPFLDDIPGRASDRRSALGELNWIFTAVTDTIAWNLLPAETFQRLFRQDLLVASMYRNYLLAERICGSMGCSPVTYPALPSTAQHLMWRAWDLAVERCLAGLPLMVSDPTYVHQPNGFFAEQLQAFCIWLDCHPCLEGFQRRPPEQLPIVLQVLLSPSHRLHALRLLCRFMDLGAWAVHMVLLVGTFPYVVRLLQSQSQELRPILVFIWAKLVAFDPSCAIDLVRSGAHAYFIHALSSAPVGHSPDLRINAAFVLTMMARTGTESQNACIRLPLLETCLQGLQDTNPRVRLWMCLLLAELWRNNAACRRQAVAHDASERLCALLVDPDPEVRAAVVHAEAAFVLPGGDMGEDGGDGDTAITDDLSIALTLAMVVSDASPLVRVELILLLNTLARKYVREFSRAAQTMSSSRSGSGSGSGVLGGGALMDASLSNSSGSVRGAGDASEAVAFVSSVSPSSYASLSPSPGPVGAFAGASGAGGGGGGGGGSSSVLSSSSSSDMGATKEAGASSSAAATTMTSDVDTGMQVTSVFQRLWRMLRRLSRDPHPALSRLARRSGNEVRLKASLIPQASPAVPSRRGHNASDNMQMPSWSRPPARTAHGVASPTSPPSMVASFIHASPAQWRTSTSLLKNVTASLNAVEARHTVGGGASTMPGGGVAGSIASSGVGSFVSDAGAMGGGGGGGGDDTTFSSSRRFRRRKGRGGVQSSDRMVSRGDANDDGSHARSASARATTTGPGGAAGGDDAGDGSGRGTDGAGASALGASGGGGGGGSGGGGGGLRGTLSSEVFSQTGSGAGKCILWAVDEAEQRPCSTLFHWAKTYFAGRMWKDEPVALTTIGGGVARSASSQSLASMTTAAASSAPPQSMDPSSSSSSSSVDMSSPSVLERIWLDQRARLFEEAAASVVGPSSQAALARSSKAPALSSFRSHSSPSLSLQARTRSASTLVGSHRKGKVARSLLAVAPLQLTCARKQLAATGVDFWVRADRGPLAREEAAARDGGSLPKLEAQAAVLDNGTYMVTGVQFHPFEPLAYVSTERDCIHVWDWERGERLNAWHNNSGECGPVTKRHGPRASAMQLLNVTYKPLVLVGSDDGAIRVWANAAEGDGHALVTAAQVLPEQAKQQRQGAGLSLLWQPQHNSLLVAGDVPWIRVWDLEREIAVQDIHTQSNECVTCLASNAFDGSVAVFGCGDGSVRLLDSRLPVGSDPVGGRGGPGFALATSWKEHHKWVVGVALPQGVGTGLSRVRGGAPATTSPGNLVVSGSADGQIKFWDVRSSTSLQTLAPSMSSMTAFAVHNVSGVMCCGSKEQKIQLLDFQGRELSMIRYHDGFLGQRIGPVSSLAFHPYHMLLGAGATDSMVSIYSASMVSGK